MAIDVTQPVWFLDDRAKVKGGLKLESVLWQDETYALCRVEDQEAPVLISLDDGEVVEPELEFWFATNEPPDDESQD
jgi:hypothetical protein